MSRSLAHPLTPETIVEHGHVPLLTRTDWSRDHPWLVQGVTTRRDASGSSLDLRLHGPAPAGEVLDRWNGLRAALGASSLVHARQVHGASLRLARPGGAGLSLTPPADGHLVREPGVMAAVSVADCVPVFILAPQSRTVAVLHAGWRGTAAGILERGVEAMWERFGIEPESLHLHLGPAISGERYEVGPEVFRGLGLPTPDTPALLDLRGHLRERAERAGCSAERVGVSAVCVYGDERFFSHRGGDGGRQVAVIGVRSEAKATD
jgi:polyphenol oxidase